MTYLFQKLVQQPVTAFNARSVRWHQDSLRGVVDAVSKTPILQINVNEKQNKKSEINKLKLNLVNYGAKHPIARATTFKPSITA